MHSKKKTENNPLIRFLGHPSLFKKVLYPIFITEILCSKFPLAYESINTILHNNCNYYFHDKEVGQMMTMMNYDVLC